MVLQLFESLHKMSFLFDVYNIFYYAGTTGFTISYELCNTLYNLVIYGFKNEATIICFMLLIAILANILDDILEHMQYDRLNAQQKKIQSLEIRVHLVENQLDDTRNAVLNLQSDLDYYIQSKVRMRLG